MKKTYIAALAAGSLAAASAFAHGGATGIVAERMEAMVQMGKAMERLAPVMRGEAEYDAEVVRQAAGDIAAVSGEKLTALFPEGTGGAPSEAKEAVWQEWEKFAALADRLEVYATGLQTAADNGLADQEAEADAGAMMGGGGATMGGSADAMMGGGASMMGGAGGMTGEGGDDLPSPEAFAQMSADEAFAGITRSCAACHATYRAESR
ncbi:MAG: c-type cytochrome [Tranquillimonas sp.]